MKDIDSDFVLFLDVVDVQRKLPCWKRALFFVCGLSDNVNEEMKTSDEQKAHLKEVISLEQDPRARKILLANCLLLVVVSVFLLIYYTVPDGGPTQPTISIPYMPFVNNGTRPY